MAIPMARPYRHEKTGIWWFRARVPLDVAAKAKGRKVHVPVGSARREILLGEAAKVSLATRDPTEAKVRHVAVMEALTAFYAGLRQGPIALSFRKRQAISGAILESLISQHQEEPGDAARWRSMGELLTSATTGTPEAVEMGQELLVGPMVDEALEERGITATVDSRRALLHDATVAFGEFFRDIAAMADRDFSRRRYPVEADAARRPARKVKASGITFGDIIDERVKRLAAGKDARGANAKTIATFRRQCSLFAAHRGSDDAVSVTRGEVEAWMVALQAEGKISNRTVGLFVVNVGTVWGWGQKMFSAAFPDASPFRGVERPSFDTIPPGERAFRLDEARAILHAARKETDPGRRWLPFFAAYTGARVGELTFLRPEDFREVEGRWFFRIDDNELRAVKTKSSRRTIPVHPALVAEGFMEFVQSAKPGAPLFKAGDNENIGRWIRRVVKLERAIQPNHGWRHLLTDFLTNTGASNRVRLALLGRASGSSEDAYGGSDVALVGLWNEIAKVPTIIPPPVETDAAKKD